MPLNAVLGLEYPVIFIREIEKLAGYSETLKSGKCSKLATHAKKQKMEGSDFSYEDMGSGDAFIEDFTATRLKDEKMEGYDCYKLELTIKPDSDMSYSRMIMWVIKENFVPIVIDYYDEDDPSYKGQKRHRAHCTGAVDHRYDQHKEDLDRALCYAIYCKDQSQQEQKGPGNKQHG